MVFTIHKGVDVHGEICIPIDTTCRHCCLGENLGENVYIMFSFMLSCIAFDQL